MFLKAQQQKENNVWGEKAAQFCTLGWKRILIFLLITYPFIPIVKSKAESYLSTIFISLYPQILNTLKYLQYKTQKSRFLISASNHRYFLVKIFIYIPHIKVTGSVSVWLCVHKDLADLLTYTVLLYSVASQRSWEDL